VKADVVLTEMLGRIVRTFNVSGSGPQKFNIGSVPGGIYFVSFETNHGKVATKFFVSE